MNNKNKKEYKSISSKEYGDDFDLLRVENSHLSKLSLSRSFSDIDSDIDGLNEEKSHFSMDTPMSVRIERIKDGTYKTQVQRKKRIKEISNFNDLWKWYWSHPIGHLPALYFFCCGCLSLLFSIFWFADNDTTFILCGLIGLTMCGYAGYKFKISISLKKQVDHYKELNLQFKKENIKLKAEVDRVNLARKTLQKTKRRLVIANNNNLENIKKFEQVENNMRLIGENAIKGMGSVRNKATEIKSKWRDEFLANEREMLQAVYGRYERKHTNKSRLGMTAEDFQEFQEMLPRRYKTRFNRMGTFSNLALDNSMLDYQEFANALDIFVCNK